MSEGKVKGIGGVFFKSKDPAKTREWYEKHFGMKMNDHGCLFEYRDVGKPDQPAFLQWSAFAHDTDYFQPSQQSFMINYRVENLEDLLKELQESGVEVVGEMKEYPYGKFAHVMDPEGNKIELWEAPTSVPEEFAEDTTK